MTSDPLLVRVAYSTTIHQKRTWGTETALESAFIKLVISGQSWQEMHTLRATPPISLRHSRPGDLDKQGLSRAGHSRVSTRPGARSHVALAYEQLDQAVNCYPSEHPIELTLKSYL